MNFNRFSQGLRMGMSPEVADAMTKVYGGSDAPKSSPGGGPYHSTTAGDSNSTSTNVSTSMQDSNYKNLLQGADSWLASGGNNAGYNTGITNPGVVQMGSAQKGALFDTINSSTSTQNTLNNQGQQSLANMLGNYDPSKTGLGAAIDASNNRMDWNYNTQVAPQVQQGAIDTGQYGSTRNGVAQGIALSNLSQQKGDAANTMAFQDQQAFNNNKSQLLQNLGNVTSGLSSGYNQVFNAHESDRALQQQNLDKSNAYQLEKWAYENNVPYNNLAAYKNLISGDMGGRVQGDGKSNQQQFQQGVAPAGATSGGGGGGSSTLGTIGMVGGAIIGGIYGGPMGAAAGASVGGGIGNAVG